MNKSSAAFFFACLFTFTKTTPQETFINLSTQNVCDKNSSEVNTFSLMVIMIIDDDGKQKMR